MGVYLHDLFKKIHFTILYYTGNNTTKSILKNLITNGHSNMTGIKIKREALIKKYLGKFYKAIMKNTF